jgi:hypothetical protein
MMGALAITKSTTINLTLVTSLLTGVATSGYFVGTAHSRITAVEIRQISHRDDDKASLKILLDIDRRLSRIEGHLYNQRKDK